MKKLLIVTVICLMVTVSLTAGEMGNDFSDYRYNPFQWVYPEYFYRADIVKIDAKKTFKAKMTKIDIFGLTGLIPEKYVGELKKKDNAVFYKSKFGIISFFFEDPNHVLCSDQLKEKEKDICSAYSSAKEYYHKLFLLTPGMLDGTNTRGDYWLIHAKGNVFKDTRKIYISEGENFTAYARILKGETTLKEEIILFHDDLPIDHSIAVGITFSDDKFMTDFLSSLK